MPTIEKPESWNCKIVHVLDSYNNYFQIRHLKSNQILHALNYLEAIKISRLMNLDFAVNDASEINKKDVL